MLCRICFRFSPPAGLCRPVVAALAVACLAAVVPAAEPPAAAQPAATPPAAAEPHGSSWHADLARARAAAAASQRPVLAVFIASWSPESRRIAASLRASAEVTALASACFEPAIVDVDVESDLTRRLGITHLPTAVVLDLGDQPLASFECPEQAAAFIATAAQAARDAAVRKAARGSTATVSDADRGGDPGRGSISMLTAKVNHLSNFADAPAEPVTAGAARPLGLNESFAGGGPAAVPEPTLPLAPPSWNAERPAAPLDLSSPAPGPRPSIEPERRDATALAQRATTAAPWLATAATAEPESSASVSDIAPRRPEAVVPPPAAAPKGFWAGIRNPFAKAEQPAAPATKPEPPVTMPPSRPQWPAPLAGLAPQPATQPPATSPPPAAVSAAAAAIPETMPVGLEGYCPVTLAEKQAWTEGRPQYGARHRGRTYLFAGPEQQRAFLTDPDRYAPALSGDDPVLAFEQGRSLPGQRRYGAYCQSRMYLFASPETRAAFEANPDKYATRVASAERSAAPATRTY
jgi:YHS domain-containing protein